MANPFRTQSKNPFRQGEITAQPATQESMDAWRDKVMGTAGMDAIGRALVTKAQSAFGNAGGDTARAVYQAPATFARGVGGGLVAANAGINQMLRDYTPLGAVPGLGDWLQGASNQGAKDAANLQAAATANYQTDIGRDVGGAINSLGATAPLTVGAIIAKNPAIMYGGMGAQTGLTEYGNARQAGLKPLEALPYAATQAEIETLTEMMPSGALVDAFKTKNPVANLIKSPLKYGVGEMAGEQLATLGQDFAQGAYIDSRTNPNWVQDYKDGRLDAARSTAVSSLVMAPGNVGIAATAQAAKAAAQGVRRIEGKNPFRQAAANPQPDQQRLAAALNMPTNPNATQNAIDTVRAAMANGGMKTRADIPQTRPRGDAMAQTLDMLRKHEGFSEGTYWDVNAHRLGYGTDTITDANGKVRRVQQGDKVSRADAERDLARRANDFRNGARNLIGAAAFDRLPAGAQAALTSVAYNYGSLNKLQTVVNAARSGDLQQLSKAIAARGVDNEGINAKRRREEAAAVLGGSGTPANQSMLSDGLNDGLMNDNLQPQYAPEDNSAQADAAEEMQRSARMQREAAEEMQDAARKTGKQTKVYLGEQMRQARLQMLEADDLQPTIADADNQYRDRNRAASQVQVNRIAQNLQPELLGDSMQADTGAPTLAKDGKTIIGGNGRVMGIAQAYAQGSGQSYKQYLIDNAEQFGLNPAEVAAMDKPVLIRRLDDDVDIAKAAVASNEGGGLGMSALEQARVDADRLPDFGTFVPGDNGELNTPANRGFIRKFVGQMPTTVQAQMVDAQGMLSQDGIRRLHNAMLHRAYGNSPALSRMVDSTDQGARNMVSAMMQAAPTIAKARDHIKSGAMHDADIAADIVSAVEKLNQLRESGSSTADYLAQQGMFEDDLSPVARDLLQFLDEHKRSAKAIATLLRNYYDLLGAQGSPNQADVFGDNTAPDKQQLLRKAADDYKQQNGTAEQNELFGNSETFRRPQDPDRQTGQQPESRRGDEAGAGEDTGGAEKQQDGLKFSRGDNHHNSKSAYEAAKAARKTELTFHQWQQVRTPEFKAWFGDWENDPDNASKVVNPRTGEPLAMYHGTSHSQEGNAFTRFDTYGSNYGLMGQGSYFTDNAGVASSYTEKGRGGNPSVYSVFLNIRNPIDMDAQADAQAWADAYPDAADYHDGGSTNESWFRAMEEALQADGVYAADGAEQVAAAVAEMGYDGVSHIGGGRVASDGVKHRVYIAHEPNQIKSATGNSGAFDAKNDDIRYSRSEDAKRTSPEQINQTRQAVEQAVGKHNMRHIEIVAREEVARPDNAEDLVGAQGWYDPKTQRITLIAEALPNQRTAQFVAWHELGHRKIDVDGWEKWQALFRTAYNGNPIIKQVADNIFKARKGAADGAALNKFLAVEEAVADLYAAHKTGDYAAFEQRNGVKVPQAMRHTLGGYFARMANHLRTVLAKVMGVERNTISDAEIYGWLKKLDQADDGVSDGLNGEVKFSIYSDRADQLMRALKSIGLKPFRDSSRVSNSEYVTVAIPGRTDEYGDEVEAKFRVSDHTLPGSYEQADFDIRADGKAAHATHGDWTDAVKWLVEKYGLDTPAVIKRIDTARSKPRGESKPRAKSNLNAKRIKEIRQRLEEIDESIRRNSGDSEAEQSNRGFYTDLKNRLQSELEGLQGGNADAKFSRQPKVDNSKSAYESAKTAGETELTFHQWQQVRTPEFKQWFGDWENDPDNASKVINPKTGEPLIVYHGSMGSTKRVDNRKVLTKEEANEYRRLKEENFKRYDDSTEGLLEEAEVIRAEILKEMDGENNQEKIESLHARRNIFMQQVNHFIEIREKESKEINKKFGQGNELITDEFVPFELENHAFDISRSADVGTHFTPSRKVAEGFAYKLGDGKGSVFPVFLNIRNLYRQGDIFSRYQGLGKALGDIYSDGLLTDKQYDSLFDRAERLDQKDYDDEREWGQSFGVISFWEKLNQMLQKKKGIGFVYRNEVEGGGDSYVAFKANQIKSATDNSGAFDAKNDDIRFSRGKDLSPQEKRLFNEIGELEVGVKAYNKLAGLLKPAFAKIRMANTAPEQFTQMMRDYRAQLNVAGRAAKAVADAGVKMTEAERKLLSDVLEKELPPGVEVSPELQELAGAMREILTQQSDDLVALEMLSEASRERFKDTYLPRLYSKYLTGDVALNQINKELGKAMRGALGNAVKGQHLKGRGLFKEVKRGEQTAYEADGWEMRHDYGNKGKKAGQVVMWRDYTREERASMGEERDAMMRFTSGYIKTQSDIAKGVLFKRIAGDGDMTSDTAVDGWTHVPDTEIAGTGGVKRYGALAGKWVHPEVAYHLQQQFYIDNAVQKVWRKILGWWKIGKTVYNAVAHVNNFISNIAMTYIAGGRLRDLPAMALEMKRKGALYNEALEHGLIGDAVDVAGLQEMFVGLNNVSDDKLLDGLIMRTLKRADKLTGQAVSKTAKFAQKSYRVEDEVFKLALYKRGKDAGLSPREAADYALTFMFDYSEVPQGVKWLRDTGILPFVSYTYKAIPALARAALTRPHKVLAVTGFMYGINALSYALLGGAGDEDEEREYMPDYQKGYTVFGTPKLIRLPWNDSKGKPIFIDVYRWLPLGDFADTQNQMGGLPLPQWATPNGLVISHAFALLGNKDTFTGRDIVKPYQSGGEKAATYGKWLAAQWLPASVGVPFSYHTNNVLDGMKNQFEGTKFADALEWMGYTGTTYRGEDKQLYRALPGAFGVKLRGEKPADMKAAKQRQIGYEVREVKADMSRIRRDNTLTDAAKQARLEKRREALERLYEKRPD